FLIFKNHYDSPTVQNQTKNNSKEILKQKQF
ncbi:MAG: hypothetical protein ACI9Z4_001022, partial [Polaribacter sp.]